MIEKIEMTCDDGSRATWEGKKPGARLSRVHQIDLHMRKAIKVSFVSRPDLNRCKVVIHRGHRKASLDYKQFLADVVDRLIESHGEF